MLTNYCDPVLTWCDALEQSCKVWLWKQPRKTFVSRFVCSRINYFNTVFASLPVLTTDLPVLTTDHLYDVLHAAARRISERHKYNHITPMLRDKIHWLPVHQRFEYKLCLTVFKALHGIAPGYIARHACAGLVSPVAFKPALSRFWQTLFYSTEWRILAFAYAGKNTWNNLPITVKASSIICAFRLALKTSFPSWLFQLKLTLAIFGYLSWLLNRKPTWT